MPAVKVEFHRLADKEYEEAFNYYAERSPETAQRFKNAVDAAVRRIADGPELLPLMSGPNRWVRVQRFRYILVFRPREPTEIVVVAVAHTSRRPGYWRRRGPIRSSFRRE
jgi:plasmid stabilization system protein ParE